MKWIRFIRRALKGPTTMEMYGLSDIEYELLEEYLRNRTFGIMYDEYSTRLNQERLNTRCEALDKFSQGGWFQGWEQRVKKEIFG